MHSVRRAQLVSILSVAALGVACPALLGDEGGADDGGSAGRPGGGDDECEEDEDCDDDEECDDGECVDAEGGGGEGGIEGDPPPDPEGPRFLSFDSNLTTIDPTDELIITAVVTDVDGVDDIIGGTLYHGATSQSYGAFVTSASEGSYEIRVSWDDINELEPIDFLGATGSRSFRARFFDQAGHEAAQTVTVALSCGGATACAGNCGYVKCGNLCVGDFANDEYCGDCETSCTGESFCANDFGNGWQTATCSCGVGDGRDAMCGDVCTDITTPQDCGGCDRTCSSDLCRSAVEDTLDVLPESARCSCDDGFDCPGGESCVCGEETWCDSNVCAPASFALSGTDEGYAQVTIAGATYNLFPNSDVAAATLCSSSTNPTVSYEDSGTVDTCFGLDCPAGAVSTDSCVVEVASNCTDRAYVRCVGVVDPDPEDSLGCVEADIALGTMTASGTTSGEDNTYSSGCNSSAADRVYSWTAPQAGTYSVEMTASWDSVVAIGYDCDSAYTCDDDGGTGSLIEAFSALQGETFVIVADGYSTNTGSFTLTITRIGD